MSLKASAEAHSTNLPAVHAFVGDRYAARTRLGAYMGKQKAFAYVASMIKEVIRPDLNPDAKMAWGGAR